MAITFRMAMGLGATLDAVEAFLGRDRDIFARPVVIVPNAGTKAWLQDRLSRRLGAAGREDGIVANVEFAYPGAITTAVQPTLEEETDPWSFDRLTFAVLGVLAADEALAASVPLGSDQEPLQQARRIAALFDGYHVRRPGMIREWDREIHAPLLAPTADDDRRDGVPSPEAIAPLDRWQFDLWRRLRQVIAVPSPPTRAMTLADPNPAPEPLLVVGLESLSHPQLECLTTLGNRGDVEVILVHPSPGLRAARGNPLRGTSPLPFRRPRDPELPEGIDPLLPVWLSGASELDDLLASGGIKVASEPADGAHAPAESLLGRMQRSIAAGQIAEPRTHAPADRSIAIHRCHSLSRQAEVLHDALLQAFEEIDGLEPHEVVIVSPCIEEAAPHLRAAFSRSVQGHDRHGRERRIALPLVIADRAIRDSSEAADLLVALLAIPGSRAGLDDVLAVAGHGLVRTSMEIDDDDLATFDDLLERTAVRWGLDAGHRSRRGLDLAVHAEAHTWSLGIERMLLGAMLPDGPARAELGGVVPLTELDPEDVAPVAKLARILAIIRSLEAATAERRPAAQWCDAIEGALLDLCGEECPGLAEPLGLIRRLRAAAAGTAGEHVAVPFEDVRRLFVAWLEEKSGRQPLRTGAITATSTVPLRGVPFRIVAVIGYDDGAVGAGEPDGADLTGRQRLVGDLDPRIDQRRALLDCLLAAGDRFVVTCNGRNVKSNKRVPMVTPLAELVDFAVRHGVPRGSHDSSSAIEIEHPRHHLDRRNFEEDGVVAGAVWSHDRLAADVLARAETAPEPPDASPLPVAGTPTASDHPSQPAEPAIVELSLLERFAKDPLSLYLDDTLGIDTWRGDAATVAATIPLDVSKTRAAKLTLELLGELVRDSDSCEAWLEARQRSGDLPIVSRHLPAIEEIALLAAGLAEGARAEDIPLGGLVTIPLDDVPLGIHRLVGTLAGVHREANAVVRVIAGTAGTQDYGRPLHLASLHLLAARAAGIDVDRAVVLSRRNDWKPGQLKKPTKKSPGPTLVDAWQVRELRLDPSLMERGDAARRLDAIAALAREAQRAPRPAFGKVLTGTAESRRAGFEQFIDGDAYGWSSERIFFGPSPSYPEVFEREPDRLAFIDAFQRLLTPVYVHGTKYTLA